MPNLAVAPAAPVKHAARPNSLKHSLDAFAGMQVCSKQQLSMLFTAATITESVSVNAGAVAAQQLLDGVR
jgi:hypothetical protein